ncbi:MAG: hypothetical protein MPN21_05140 [Thermoanaerobaculia bacterium]|nr:hypothetical protein [Thermoanaerobaculia bacterium]
MNLLQPNIDRKAQQDHLATVCERGLEACRRGDFEAGMVDLLWLIQGKQAKNLPSAAYSYLGYGVARYKRNVAQGVRLCKHAIKLEWFQPDNYLNLARSCLLSDRYKREAVEAVRDGLKVDPDHPELLALQTRLGHRRPPVLGFLPRSSILNRILGGLRASFSRSGGSKKNGGEAPA